MITNTQNTAFADPLETSASRLAAKSFDWTVFIPKVLFGAPKFGQDFGCLFLRLGLAFVIFPHGAQKALGWWGGYGFSGTMGYFTESLGIPWIAGLLAIAAEFAGPFALILGIGTRLAAFGIGMTMLVALVRVHLPFGFFMDWFGNQEGEGIEFFLLAIALSVSLMATGAGRWSLDHRLFRRIKHSRP